MKKRIVTFACYGFVSLVNEKPGTVYKNENRVDLCGERDAGPDEHLRNHLHHLLQTNKLILTLLKSRLNNVVALLGKAL